jgi:hypothetical protein
MDHGEVMRPNWRTFEADNGAVTAVDVNTVARLNGGGAYIVGYVAERDEFEPANLRGFTFDCRGSFSVLSADTGTSSPMMYAPPRSIAASIGALACKGK